MINILNWAAVAVVDGFVVLLFVRGVGEAGKVFAGADAFIGIALRDQAIQGSAVKRKALALVHHGWLPIETEPAQVFDHCRDEVWLAAVGIKIVVAEEQCATSGAGAFGGDPEGARMAEMQIASGRWGDAASVR